MEMETEKNLSRVQGIEKIKEITEHQNICMMATGLNTTPLSVIPMTTQEVDDKGNLWFFTGKDTEHYKNISKDHRVQLMYANKSDREYLSVYGTATLVTDENKVEELWNPVLKTWFDGKNDPNLSLIKVTAEDAYYWDTKDNKLVTLIKIAGAEITGTKKEIGIKGEINM